MRSGASLRLDKLDDPGENRRRPGHWGGYPGDVFALFQIQNVFVMAASLLVFVIQAWAFVDAVSHRPEVFVAADKLTKPAWLIILGLAVAAHMLIWNPVSFLNLIGAVAGIVYIVDVRPALRSLTQR